MCKNTIESAKREVRIDSEFWRKVIEQECINRALSIMMNEIAYLKEKIRARLGGGQGVYMGSWRKDQ